MLVRLPQKCVDSNTVAFGFWLLALGSSLFQPQPSQPRIAGLTLKYLGIPPQESLSAPQQQLSFLRSLSL